MSTGLMTAPTQKRFEPRDPVIDLVRKLKVDPADRRTREALATAIAPGMLAAARRFCRLEQDADEAAQEALVAVLQHIGDLQDPQSFRSWMYRIVYRASLRAHSGPGGDGMTTLTLDSLELPDVRRADPLEAASDNERLDLLRSAVNELDREAAGLLHLLYVDSLSLQEAAVVLGRPRTTIADLRDKALAVLRGKLRRNGVAVSEPAMGGLLLLAMPQPISAAAVQRVIHGAWARVDGLVGTATPAPVQVHNPMLSRMSLSKAFLLSCMSSLVIACIFLVMQYPRKTGESATESTLRVLLNSIQSYKTLYGGYPVDREFLEAPADSRDRAEWEAALNANVVQNLLSNKSLGRMASVGEGRYRILADGSRVVIDEWSLPFVIQPLVERRGTRWTVTGMVAYSRGRDGDHDWLRLAYLARAGGECWPPSEGIVRQWPVDDPNRDNVYLDPEAIR